jgi:5-methylthioadenosine/S-adenosylhomocysteine deaminase
MKTLLKDATIITMNSRREIFPRADLLIDDDRIQSVSPGLTDRSNDVDQLLDCKGKVIMPGMVSAHTHLTGMFQRGLWDETSFESWSRNQR